MMLPLPLLLLMASSEGFLMTRVDPGSVTVKPGDSISLLCVVSAHILSHCQPNSQGVALKCFLITQVDSAYEFCKWINPQEQECDFVWKRAKGNITTQECHSAFSEKVPVVIIIVNINIKIIATVILASVNATTQE